MNGINKAIDIPSKKKKKAIDMIIIIILKYSRLRWKVFTITIYILFFSLRAIYITFLLHRYWTLIIMSNMIYINVPAKTRIKLPSIDGDWTCTISQQLWWLKRPNSLNLWISFFLFIFWWDVFGFLGCLQIKGVDFT